MNIKFTGKYKSLTNFNWDNIPKFAVITGPNGVGKTQLLEVISNHYNNVNLKQAWDYSLKINNAEFEGWEVIYNRSEWGFSSSNHNVSIKTSPYELPFLRYNEYKKSSSSYSQPLLKGIVKSIAKKLNKKETDLNKDDFLNHYPDLENFQNGTLVQYIANLFLNYRIQFLEYRDKNNCTPNEAEINLGPKPWRVLEDMVRIAGLSLKFTTPESNSLADGFKFSIYKYDIKEKIQFYELSSGEKVIISLFLYLYSSKKYTSLPKLMILDEPDAHLHPSMSKILINVIQELSQKHDIQFIITTHSPSTVVLTPNELLFEMKPLGENRIVRSPSKNYLINKLTEGLLIVSPNSKYVLVEDEDDKRFYSELYQVFIRKQLINPDISLIFVSASNRNNKNKNGNSGGKTVVKDWVLKLRNSGLNQLIQGLTDLDNNILDSNSNSSGIHLLNRYSLENYLLDPIVVFVALLDHNKAPKIPNFEINIAEEYRFREELSQEEIQKIANFMVKKITPYIEDLTEQISIKVDVEFTNGKVLSYPKWLIKRQGHSLMKSYRKIFDPKSITTQKLTKAMLRINFIPSDLVVTFRNIQNHS